MRGRKFENRCAIPRESELVARLPFSCLPVKFFLQQLLFIPSYSVSASADLLHTSARRSRQYDCATTP